VSARRLKKVRGLKGKKVSRKEDKKLRKNQNFFLNPLSFDL
jgi:hypothetical protein